MLIDMEFERCDRTHGRKRDPVLRPPIDDARRHMQEHVEHQSMLTGRCAEKAREQRSELRADTLDRGQCAK